MCCTHDIPGFAPGAATVPFCCVNSCRSQHSSYVAEVLRGCCGSAVNALLHADCAPAQPVSGVCFAQHAVYSCQCCGALPPPFLSAIFSGQCHPPVTECFHLHRALTIYFQESNPEISSKSIQEKLPLWSKTYDLPLELLTDVWALHFNSSASAGSNDALLQEVMSLAVAAVDLQAARLSSLFTSQELRCLTGLLPVGTIHYHQNMVPSNSHVLALIEPSDLAAFEVAFKAHQAEDRPAGVLGSSTSTSFYLDSPHTSQAQPLLPTQNWRKRSRAQSECMACLYLSRHLLLALFTETIVTAA